MKNVEGRVGQAGGDFLEVAGKGRFSGAIGVVVVNQRAVSGQNEHHGDAPIAAMPPPSI
jgi:hypothetical protein